MSFPRFLSSACFGALVLGLACGNPESAFAQGNRQDPLDVFKSIKWQQGPCTVKLRNIGEVKVPAGYKFADEAGTRSMMEVTGNLPNPKDMGLLCPSSYDLAPGSKDWFLVFVWEDVGYVKDDEKGQIPEAELLQNLKDGQEQGNKELAARGFSTLTVVGWEQKPFYDPQTNNLTWGIRIRDQKGFDTINYNSRILGRGGVVSVELVIVPEQLQKELPKYNEILKGYSYVPGQRYSEWREGDRVAAYGLTALIAGGAVAAAAKSGILAKLGKFIIYIVVAVVGGIGALFKKLFGGKQTSEA